jgi:hypothetical protein
MPSKTEDSRRCLRVANRPRNCTLGPKVNTTSEEGCGPCRPGGPPLQPRPKPETVARPRDRTVYAQHTSTSSRISIGIEGSVGCRASAFVCAVLGKAREPLCLLISSMQQQRRRQGRP